MSPWLNSRVAKRSAAPFGPSFFFHPVANVPVNRHIRVASDGSPHIPQNQCGGFTFCGPSSPFPGKPSPRAKKPRAWFSPFPPLVRGAVPGEVKKSCGPKWRALGWLRGWRGRGGLKIGWSFSCPCGMLGSGDLGRGSVRDRVCCRACGPARARGQLAHGGGGFRGPEPVQGFERSSRRGVRFSPSSAAGRVAVDQHPGRPPPDRNSGGSPGGAQTPWRSAARHARVPRLCARGRLCVSSARRMPISESQDECRDEPGNRPPDPVRGQRPEGP